MNPGEQRVTTPDEGLGARELIGKYRLIRELGRGGMGVVYLAVDTSLGREVALKALHPALTVDMPFLLRFREEAKAIAAVTHPNIVRIHAFDCIDGQYVIDMEYVPKGSMAKYMTTPLAPPMAVHVIRQVLLGLAACHARGIIHRDIKPSNLLLAEDERVLVGDFGLAKLFSSEESSVVVSSSGLFLGTPRYAAPEAWNGDPPCAAWDVYACGVVLYEALAGMPPFDGRTPLQLAQQMATCQFMPIDAIITDISPRLAQFLHTLLERDAARRPRDAGEALALMRELGVDQESEKERQDTMATALPGGKKKLTPKPPPGHVQEAVQAPPRNRILPLALAGIFVCVAALALWAAVKYTRGDKAGTVPPAPTVETSIATASPTPPLAQAPPAAAAVPASPPSVPAVPSSSPDSLRVLGTKLIFVAGDLEYGRELRATDTVTGKTVLLSDFSEGKNDTAFEMRWSQVANGVLMVVAREPGAEASYLVRTDGTPEGTYSIFRAACNQSGRFDLRAANSKNAFFNLIDNFHDSGLYMTDGTKEGTKKVRVVDGDNEATGFALMPDDSLFFSGIDGFSLDYFEPGGDSTRAVYRGSSSIFGLVRFRDGVFFDNFDVHGREPWIATQKPGTAHMLKDIYPGKNYSENGFLATQFRDDLLFVADDNVHGTELWISDGTEAGTRILKDLNPGGMGSKPLRFTISGDKCFFTAETATTGRELWITDGTEVGTTPLGDINPGMAAGEPYAFCAFHNGLLLSMGEPIHGEELWFSDGTPAGTRLLKEIYPGPQGSGPYSPVVVGKNVYFTANDPEHGEELWVTDGTEEGTRLYADLYAPAVSTVAPLAVCAAIGKVFFVQNDDEHGEELWVRDGDGLEPRFIRDIFPGPDGSLPSNFVEFNQRLYFTANDGMHGRELWRTDGTDFGTAMVDDYGWDKLSSDPENLTVYQDGQSLGYTAILGGKEKRVLHMNRDENVFEIWPQDRTRPLLNPRNLTGDKEYLHFVADLEGQGTILWRFQKDYPEPEQGTLAPVAKIH